MAQPGAALASAAAAAPAPALNLPSLPICPPQFANHWPTTTTSTTTRTLHPSRSPPALQNCGRGVDVRWRCACLDFDACAQRCADLAVWQPPQCKPEPEPPQCACQTLVAETPVCAMSGVVYPGECQMNVSWASRHAHAGGLDRRLEGCPCQGAEGGWRVRGGGEWRRGSRRALPLPSTPTPTRHAPRSRQLPRRAPACLPAVQAAAAGGAV